jgi:hypothetical protein
VLVAAAAVVAGLVGARFGSFTVGATLWVLAVGVLSVGWAVLALGPRSPVRVAGPDEAGPGAGWWLLAAAPIVVGEVWAVAGGAGWPSLSLLADPVLDAYWPRAVAATAWVAGFWALARRVVP